jgi:PAS domain S-box-containing protein
MAQRHANRKIRDYHRMPRHLALGYAIVGAAWILLSDRIAFRLTNDPQLLSAIQTYKGWFFILATAVALYFLSRLFVAKSYELMGQLVDSETRFRQFFDSVPDVLFSARLPDLQMTFVTPSLYTLLGYAPAEIIRQPLLWRERLIEPEAVLSGIREQLEDDGTFSTDHQMRTKSGELRWIRTRGRAAAGGGLHATVFGVMTDITELRETQQRETQQSLRDELTGLLSLPAFALALDTLVSSTNRGALPLSCACLGVDDFTRLRSQAGREQAQQLVRLLGRQLVQALRNRQLIGGGENVLIARADDTFLFAIPERSSEALLELADHLLDELVDAVACAHDARVALRIGIASHPLPGQDAQAYVREARDALETARRDTHTRVSLHNVLERRDLTEEALRRRRGAL